MALTKITGEGIGTTSGDLTVDVAGDIILDADGADVIVKDGGTSIGKISNIASDLAIYSTTSGHTGVRFHDSGLFPTDNTGQIIDNDSNLGHPDYRFKDLYLSGGVYLGGTGSANYLQDYETGTWTPSVGGNASYTTALGRYTKIGNHVLAQFDMTINVLGTGDVAAISGFPFTHENIMVASGSISYFSGVASNVYYLSFYVVNNSTTAYMTGITSAGGTISNTLATFQNGARVNGMVSYRTS